MAVSTSVPLNPEEPVQVQFTLPNHREPFLAESTICWLKAGQFGVRFVSLRLERESELQEWLSRKLEETLPESIAYQFQEAENSSLKTSAIENRMERLGIPSS
jgi:hypothetical protein